MSSQSWGRTNDEDRILAGIAGDAGDARNSADDVQRSMAEPASGNELAGNPDCEGRPAAASVLHVEKHRQVLDRFTELAEHVLAIVGVQP
jgi:hypothetical protein